jgi:hypothetical protein
MTDPPTLFPLGLLEPIDASSQLDRLPGVDAPCLCRDEPCRFPFCPWKDHQEQEAA